MLGPQHDSLQYSTCSGTRALSPTSQCASQWRQMAEKTPMCNDKSNYNNKLKISIVNMHGVIIRVNVIKIVVF